MTRFHLGINYWPRRSAMYMWQRFDAGEVRDDMARIASLGLDCVRFFLMWDSFQPEAARIDSAALARLRVVMDAINGAGLAAIPTLFTGHMSGVNWLPEWALDAHTAHGRFRTYSRGRELPFGSGDFYRQPLLGAQVLQAKTVARALKGHPALWLWDVGNEFSNLREPQTPVDAANWSQALSEVLMENSGAGVTGGTHGEDLTRDRHLRPSSICAPWTFATMHGYSVYFPESRGRLDHEVVPFLCRLMQSCAEKPVFFSEFGNPTCPPDTVSPYDRVPLPGEASIESKDVPPNAAPFACLTEEEMCAYAYAVLDRLQRAGALGALWWCYADYADDLRTLPPFDRAPHELTFGIIRADGSQKPIANTLEQFAKESRHTMPLPPALVDEASYYAGLPATLSEAYRHYCEVSPQATTLDEALEPLKRRMERVRLSRDFIASLLVPGASLQLSEVAMRWAGMPNKNERAATHEVLDALTTAGLIEKTGEERWIVRKSADAE